MKSITLLFGFVGLVMCCIGVIGILNSTTVVFKKSLTDGSAIELDDGIYATCALTAKSEQLLKLRKELELLKGEAANDANK